MSSSARPGVVTAVLGIALFAASCGGGEGDRSSSAATTTTSATRAAATCPDAGSEPKTVRYASMPGVVPNLLSLDVYPSPHGCPAPVVVWVHGGGWQVGDKRNQLGDKLRMFGAAGYTVVSVNYRLTDPTAPSPVRFPMHDDDVAAAVAWVHDQVDRFGGDPARLALVGHSAGAQIVAGLGTDERYLAAHGLGLDAVRCVVALDTEGYDVASVAATGNPIYRAAFGDDPSVWLDASPQSHVAPGKDIPSFLVAERGTARRRLAATRFAGALRDAGVSVTEVDAGTLSHADVNAALGRPGDTVITPPVSTFLDDCFAPTP